MTDSAEYLDHIFQQQKKAFLTAQYPTLEQRRTRLKQLKTLLLKHQDAIIAAISADFGHRSSDETKLVEMLPSIMGIQHSLKHLKKWMKPNRRQVSILFQPAQAYVLYQPLGVVGIIVPWNYPLFLAIGPLCQALAAGNRAMLKMSEFTPNFSALFKTILAEVFPEDLVCVITGDHHIAAKFSALPFDHLLFTGATSIGRQVMRAASEHLTPVTLELGGKSPSILGKDAPFEESVRRIAFGKAINAGQTCVAPDYVFVPEDLLNRFIETYQNVIREFYPELAHNSDCSQIINARQTHRLQSYLDDAQAQGAKITSLYPATEQHFGHYLVQNVHDDMLLMQNEIFGSILPILTYRHIDEVIDYINQRPRPLALYYFGYDKNEQQHFIKHTHSGGVCLNETLVHVAQDDLPFGGIGASGLGHYHGHEGFLTFSHAKSVFVRPKFSLMKLIYPPYGTWLQKLIFPLFLR
ncbi:coniferyl aldehyde dehydrogenase [Acinetobacter sp. ME22]|uniref:coniferyl aldehyde dehydrogenase n=1 Tax=Acinetobacter sp. ME22 TaxID=2904802 RepID=UPI001EDC41A2|nr:coniferyl aldehyde dehydrogenase [Acinetobacter sp. ME22]MCG2572293.1 coniferyl aldehyde dehydrogenase [Acinetobacter sp. ME22]